MGFSRAAYLSFLPSRRPTAGFPRLLAAASRLGASGLAALSLLAVPSGADDASAQWWYGARLSVSPGSVSENGGKQLVTVTAEVSEWGTSTNDLSYVVTVGKGGDSAVSGTDYKAVSKFNVTVKANRRSGSNSFNLEPIGDTAWEGDETITIHAEGTGGAQSTSLTLTDEGDRPYSGPQVTLSANPAKLSEADGATTVTVTATSTAHSAARTVTVSVGHSGTATSGTDYAAVSDFTISLAKDATSATGTFTLTPTQDKLAEGDETIALAGNVEGVSAKLTGTTLTLTDDDKAPAVTLSVSPVSVTENGGAQTVTVTATSAAAAAKARTLLVAVGNRRKDTATPGTDFTVVPAFNITLAANATTATGTFTLTPTNDTSVEDAESISIDGTPESGGADFTVGGAAMALTDDDAQPAVTLTATPASVDEAALATSVTVKATAASAVAWARAVTVSVGGTGSAASGTDYAAVSNFDITIAANATSGTGTFSLKPTQDTTNEGNETIGVAGTSLNTTVTGTTVTLADDDINPAVTLSVSPASVSESASATTVTVTATGASAMTTDRTVSVKVGGGTATSGTDYAAVSDFTITIAANATSGTGTFTLTPTNDTTVEGGETIGVSGTSTSTTVTGTTVGITDDDTYPAVTLSVSTSSVAESASATSVTVTATAASAISSARTVTVSVGQTGTAASGTDYAAVTDFDITIAANATSGTGSFTLTPTQDSVFEHNETIGVDGSSPNTTMTNATITLTDDEKDTVTLSLSRQTLGEEASGTSVTVTATAATAIAAARTVTVSVGGTGTATSGTDYTAVSDFTITIAANATSGTGSFTLTPTQDTTNEGNETIGIAGTNSLSTVTGTTLTLVDDDQATISLTSTKAAFAEGWSGTIDVTATRPGNSTASAVDVTVTVGQSWDSAKEGEDYTEVADYTITIPAGQTSASKGFTTSGIRDIKADNNERFSICGLATGYKVNCVPNGIGIFEWGSTIGLTADVSSVNEADGATTVTVTATIHPTIYGNTPVTVSVGGGTATSGTDYAAVSNFTLTIPNKTSSVTGTFTLTPTRDSLLESDETININGSGWAWAPYNGRGTSITLTDAQTVALSATPSSVSEGAPPTQVAVTATATGTESTPRTVTVSVGGSGTATSGTDYAAVSDFDITIPANKTGATNTFTLTPTKDSAGEGDETIGVSGSSTVAYVYPTTLTLADTNPAVTLTASPSSISEGASGTSVTVTATASAALATARTVTVSVGSGTATSGTDYAAVSDFTITIAANETKGTGTFTLTPTDDTSLEGDETIHVTGTSSEAATISRTTLTLTDDDLPTIALTTVPSYVDVAEDGSRESVTVRATAAAAMKAETTVTLAIGAGGDSATKTTDYTTSNVQTITIPKDQSTAEASFELTPVEDTLVEGNESISVSGSSSGGHTVTGTSVTLTDDDRYRITLSASPSSVGEGASATSVTVTATAGKAISSARTVKVKVGGSGTATSGTDYAAVSDFDVTIAANATSGTGTFTLTPTQDTSVEGNETIGVAGTSALSRVSGTTVTLSDDDSYPAITLSANPSSVSEGASGTSVTVTATAASAISSARTVTVSVGGSGTATAGTDYATVADFDITIAASATSGTGTFTLTPTQDTAVEGSETIGVAGTSPSSTVTATTVTLSDDDTHAITLSASPSTVPENKASETITVTAALNVARAAATTVTVSVGESGDEATSGTDYKAVSDFTITIAANKTSGTGTFTFEPKTDSAYEGLESVTISGTTASGGGGGANANSANTNTSIPVTDTSLSIRDASNYPAVSLSAAPSSVGEEAGATSVTVTATAASAIASSREVTVSVGGSGTAASGTDYTAVTDYIVKIAANATSGTGTFTLTPTQDNVFEGSETIGVAGSSLSTTVTGTTLTLTDDDDAAVAVNDTSEAEGDDLTFTVTLSEAVQGGLTVTPDFTDVTATEGTDYDENTTALTFTGTKGETQTFTVSTTQDDVVEGDETFTVGLTVSDAPAGVTATDTGTGTIESGTENNVDTATLTIDDVSAAEGDSLTFTVTLSEAVQGGLTVTPGSFTNGTAASGDYKKEANPQTLSFTGTKGETHSFKVPTTEDAVLEAAETFTVGMSVSGTTLGSRITSTDTGTGTINNDDSAEVTIADASADEGDDMTFTVTLSAAVQGGVTVTPDFTDVSAVEGTDYDENTTALSFTGTKGETKTFTVSTTEDDVVEGAETFTVGLSVSNQPTGTSVTDSDTGTGTINNDDGAVVTVNDAEADEGDAITFTVTLGAAVQGGLTVTPDFTDATAAEGTDYDENTAALSFTGTKGETKTFTVATTEDAVLEADETFTVGLTVSGAPTGTTVTDTDTGTGTIDDDDSAAVTVNDADADEGDSMTFTVTLSAAVQGGLTVTPDFTDGTAAEGTDYDENTAALSFTGTKGETQTFTVSTTEDAVVEAAETFTVGLTASDAPTGTSVTDTDEGTGTINNDDGAVVTVNDARADEGDAITFTVTLGAAVQGGLTVTPDFTDGTAAEGTDYDENTAALSFTGTKGETKSFTVSTTEDAVLEAHETFTVGLTVSNQPSGTTVTDTDTGTGTIDDDDAAAVTIADADADEGDAITFTVTLSAAVQGGLTVTPDFTDVTAAEGTDYDENTAALTFTGTAGETRSFTVSTTEDGVLEADETFTVGLSASNAPTGRTVTSTDTGTGTIDNDDRAAVTVDDDDVTEGGTLTFTVTLDNDVQGGLTVTPGYTDVTADKDASKTTNCLKKSGSQDSDCRDYTANTSALTFTGTKGETQSFTVSTVTDGVVEGDETFTVDLTVSKAPPGVTATDTGTGTIDNDDEHPKTTVTGPSKPQKGEYDVTITFTKEVKDLTAADLAVVNGTAMSVAPAGSGSVSSQSRGFASAMSGGGGSSVWTATIDPVANLDGEVTVTVPEETATDQYGNGNVASSALSTPADLIPPTLSIQGPSRSTGLEAFDVTIPFSEPVSGFEKSDVKVSNGSATSFSGSGKSYKASITPAANGQVTVWVEVDAAVDVAGNGNDKKATYSMQILLPPRDVHHTGTVTIDDAAADEGGDLTFTVSLDKEITGGFKVTPVFTDGTASAGSDYTANTKVLTFSGSAGETHSFTVAALTDGVVESAESFTVGLTASDGPHGLQATDTGAGTIRDAGGAKVTIDDAAADEGGDLTFTVSLDQAVQGGFTVTPVYTDGSASAGSDYTANIAALTFSGTAGETRSFAVATAADGVVESDESFTVGLTLSNAPSGVTAADTGSGTIRDSDVAPSVTLSGPWGTQTGSFDVTVAFSKVVTGFDKADLSVTGGSVASLSGSGSSYTAAILPGPASGTVTVSVPAAAAVDGAGNGNTASAPWSAAVDLDRPSAAVAGPSATQTGSFDVTVTFSEPVTGFQAADLSVTGGSVSSLAGSDSTYTATILPGGAGRGVAAVTVSVPADAAADAAGHGNTASAPFTVPVDLDAPSAVVTGPASLQAGSFDVTVTFSEAVTGFAQADLSVTGGSVSSLSGSGSSYTAAIQPDPAGASVTVSVPADAAADAAGHGNTASAAYTVAVDLAAPSAAISGPSRPQPGSFTVTVTFSEPVTGFDRADLSVSGGSATSLSGTGSTYTAAILPAGSGGLTVSVPADVAVDAAGHGNTASAAYTVSADLSGPAVAISGPSRPQPGSFGVRITFSEPVTGFVTADLSVTNGSVTSGLSGSGSSYSATIGPAASGPVTMSVAAGVAEDAAGHDNTASAPFTVMADLEAPTLSLDGPRTVTGLDAFEVTAVFSERVTGFEQADLSVTNGSVSSLSGSGASYQAMILPAATGALTVSVPADAAVDAAGHGNASAELSVQVVERPNRPPVFSGPNQRQVAENTTSGNDIGAPVTATDPDGDDLTYRLLGPDAGSFDLDPASGQLLTRAILDYETRASYTVTVMAVDGRGGTAFQPVTVTLTDEDEPPPAPAAPTVAAVSTVSLTVTWTAPATTGRPPVTDYDVEYRTAGGSWTDAGHDGAALTATLAGLSADTAYEARVRATNHEGISPWSAPGQGRTPAAPTAVVPAGGDGAGDPGAVLVEMALAVDENTEAGAAVGALTASGGGDAQGYTYTLEGPDAEWFELDEVTGQLRVATALDYETRSSYLVVVVVSDDRGGVIRRTVTITVADKAEPPPAPDAPSLTAVSPSSLIAAWTAPQVPDGAPPVTGYDLEYRAAGSDTWTDAGHAGAGTAATLTGLSADTAYEARVRARNDEGVSPWSAPGQGRTQMLPLAAPVLEDQAAVAGTAFRYQFDAVAEADGYRAALADGSALPAWLGFDAGTRVFAGTPPAAGALEIEVTARDDRGRSSSATFTLTVAAAPLVAVDDEATVEEGGSVRIDVLANDRGLAGRSVSVTVIEAPAHGTARIGADGVVTYVHNAGEMPADTFRYRADTSSGTGSSEATVTLAVTPVNDAPVADAGDDQEVEEGAAVRLSGAGTDAEGQTLTFAWTQTGGPAVDLAGADSASPTFTAPDQLLEDAALVFELTVTDADGAASAPDAVTVTVDWQNDAPVFGGPYAFTLDENQDGRETPVAVGQVSALDPEGRAVTYTLDAGDETRFALDAATGRLTYTGPGEDAESVDAYTLAAGARDPDGAAASVEVTVTIGDLDEPGLLTLTPAEPEAGQAVQGEVTDPDGPVTVRSWQWSRSRDGRQWQAIDGATGSQYTPARADIGLWLSLTVVYEVEGSEATLTARTDAPVTAPADDPLRRSALAAVGRSVAEEVVETLSSRIQAERGEEYFIVNGHRAELGPPEARDRAPARRRVGDDPAAAEGLLPSETTANRSPSAFRMSVDDADRWTLWGRESVARFDGRNAGFGFDGRMMSGFVGLDYRRRQSETGLGLALAHTRSDVEFGDSSSAGDARVSLTHVLPYAHWRPRADLDLWSLAGYGRGRLSMAGKQTVGLRLAAAGLRWDLRSVEVRSVGRVDLAARADAFAVSLRPEDEAPAGARRGRLALEGRSHWQVNAVESVRPGLDVGLLWDGGDADRGPGLELAGELAYANALHGVNVEARLRRLIVHQAGGFRQWGASVVFRRESGDRRGLQMSLGPQWGESGSQVRSLWQGDRPALALAGDDGRAAAWNPDEITFTSGYGLVLSRAGRVTPFLEAGAGRAGRLRLGTRWEWDAAGASRLEIFGEQRGLDGAEEPERGVQVQAGFQM